jgi:hypothetical protein
MAAADASVLTCPVSNLQSGRSRAPRPPERQVRNLGLRESDSVTAEGIDA